MKEIIVTINGQLQQLQILMHRTMFGHLGRGHSPHRGQGRALTLLKMKPEISQRELTYLLNMSKQSVAELMAKLEKNGYITREPSEADKRGMTIKLTEEGAKVGTYTDDNTLETEKVFGCLNDDELAAFSDYLERIIKQYEEQFPDEDFEKRRQMMESFMEAHGHGFEHDHHHYHGRGRGRGRHRDCDLDPTGSKSKPSENGENENEKGDE